STQNGPSCDGPGDGRHEVASRRPARQRYAAPCCLHDEALPLDVRVTGALTLLYGMPITRIVALTRSDLTGGSPPHLRIGEHPVALPPAVHQLLQRQADHTEPISAVGRITPRPSWLIPGYA